MRAWELFVFYLRLTLTLVWLIVASIISFPLALFRWKHPENNFLFSGIYGPTARAIMGIRLEVEGAEHLHQRPAVYVANHQSGLDLGTLAGVFPRGAVVIGKKEIRFIPIFGLMFEAFGNVLINRKNRTDALGGLRKAVELMKHKNFSIWIFPEGTRNAAGRGLLPFKKGAFYMAIQAQVPIVPIVCSSLERLVNFRGRYARSGILYVKVLPPVLPTKRGTSEVEDLLKATRVQMLQALEELNFKADQSVKTTIPRA